MLNVTALYEKLLADARFQDCRKQIELHTDSSGGGEGYDLDFHGVADFTFKDDKRRFAIALPVEHPERVLAFLAFLEEHRINKFETVTFFFADEGTDEFRVVGVRHPREALWTSELRQMVNGVAPQVATVR